MSIFGIATNILGQIGSPATPNPNKLQFKQGFQQLGQDLQSGNLSQAQSDFASLQQLLPTGQQSSLPALASGAQSSNPLAAVSQLAQDLKSGNLTAAQSDLAAVQRDTQPAGHQQRVGPAHQHHHHGGGESSQPGPISTLFGQLSQNLQSGNLSAAQQVYVTLQQDFQQFGQRDSSNSSLAVPSPTGGTLNISA